MTYLSNLEWMRNLRDFSEQQQKVLLALSHERFRWRTMPNIAKASGLEQNETEQTISELVEKGLVRPSFSKSKKVILGLRERVN